MKLTHKLLPATENVQSQFKYRCKKLITAQ